MKSILPIILIILALTGAITYSLAKRTIPEKPVDNIGISANELESDLTPTPAEIKTISFSGINSPSVSPTVTMPDTSEEQTVQNVAQKTTVTETKTTICTPVYGSANTCTEHIVVDTGAENAAFFNLAGLAYLAGLMSFIKAKSLKA